VALVNDARIVLATGTPDGWGLVVISGTGSIAYARSPQGQVMRSGGWGYLLGDEGSGYDIGLRALQAVMRASDGRGESTVLENAILTEWGLRRAEDLVRKVYGGLPRAEIARLSEIVERCAGAGDRVSTAILEGAGAELSAAAVAVVHRLGLINPVPAAFTGGVLVNGARIRQSLLREASEHGLVLEPVSLVTEPARGAVRLALEML
jgi:N-acetylglucosamine kinase-like BadF-type ATPase